MKNKTATFLTLFVSLCIVFAAGCKSPEAIVEPVKIIPQEIHEQQPAEIADDNVIEPQNEEFEDQPVVSAQNFCTLSVQCENILLHMNKLKKEKQAYVPENGIIFAEKAVEFNPGETVFDVLLREMKNNKIHMDFTESPMYKSVYIKGISNLYEFDCGELSGWTYRVNGEQKSVGCSQCILNSGDKVEWIYTCDLGRDLN